MPARGGPQPMKYKLIVLRVGLPIYALWVDIEGWAPSFDGMSNDLIGDPDLKLQYKKGLKSAVDFSITLHHSQERGPSLRTISLTHKIVLCMYKEVISSIIWPNIYKISHFLLKPTLQHFCKVSIHFRIYMIQSKNPVHKVRGFKLLFSGILCTYNENLSKM